MSVITPTATTEALREYIDKYSNWGRWGEADELGAVNLITPAIVREASRGVSLGRVIGLGLPFDQNGPQTGVLGRYNCLRYSTATGTDHAYGLQQLNGAEPPHGFGYADDVIAMPLQSATHWDVLSHIFHEGRMYNGRPASSVTATGAQFSGAEKWRDRLVGRGVLLDLPATLGVDWLEDGHAIDADQLEAAAEFGKVEIREGDILLLRTGRLKRARAEGWGDYAGGDAPGLSYYTIPWLATRGIAAVASDTWGVEVRPNELPGSFQPFHIPALVYMGLALGEMFDFDGLSQACAEAGKYQVLFSGPPLAFTGSAGGPPGPVAII
ncbi:MULTISPECIES: cyclase family protein [Streptomyces]|uniref:cyclase family protein n=1 Tax=Streptomyces TaxID=1883 RepID=UPI002F911D09|nr:cyclase family protein [Streptomyces chartreusis]WTA33494.1 cyclase family protein [Streptomyces chartreusis]